MMDYLFEYLGYLSFCSAFQTPTQTPCPDCGYEYLKQDVETLQLHCPACIGVFTYRENDHQ